jgi:type IV pilus assembly protein PilY1
VDLLVASERVNTDPQLVLGILAVNSNIIETGNVCRAGGSSWINYIDYATGGTVSAFLGNALATSPTAALVGTKLVDFTVLGDDSGAKDTRYRQNNDVNTTRRVSWRDLVHD